MRKLVCGRAGAPRAFDHPHIKAVALPILRHRLITNFNAEADGITTDDVVRSLLETTPVDEADADIARVLAAVAGEDMGGVAPAEAASTRSADASPLRLTSIRAALGAAD